MLTYNKYFNQKYILIITIYTDLHHVHYKPNFVVKKNITCDSDVFAMHVTRLQEGDPAKVNLYESTQDIKKPRPSTTGFMCF